MMPTGKMHNNPLPPPQGQQEEGAMTTVNDSQRICPHCGGSLSRYEDPLAKEMLAANDAEIARLKRALISMRMELAGILQATKLLAGEP